MNSMMRIDQQPHAHVLMTQMSVEEDKKKFVDKGNDPLLKDLSQLHNHYCNTQRGHVL